MNVLGMHILFIIERRWISIDWNRTDMTGVFIYLTGRESFLRRIVVVSEVQQDLLSVERFLRRINFCDFGNSPGEPFIAFILLYHESESDILQSLLGFRKTVSLTIMKLQVSHYGELQDQQDDHRVKPPFRSHNGLNDRDENTYGKQQ